MSIQGSSLLKVYKLDESLVRGEFVKDLFKMPNKFTLSSNFINSDAVFTTIMARYYAVLTLGPIFSMSVDEGTVPLGPKEVFEIVVARGSEEYGKCNFLEFKHSGTDLDMSEFCTKMQEFIHDSYFNDLKGKVAGYGVENSLKEYDRFVNGFLKFSDFSEDDKAILLTHHDTSIQTKFWEKQVAEAVKACCTSFYFEGKSS
jgi:hypothetical protein